MPDQNPANNPVHQQERDRPAFELGGSAQQVKPTTWGKLPHRNQFSDPPRRHGLVEYGQSAERSFFPTRL